MGPDTSSASADEGTKAHELSEYRLAERLGREVSVEQLLRIQSSEYYCPEMEEYVSDYCDKVMEKYNAMLAEDPSTQILLERRLNFSEWVPEGFGTGDVLIINSVRIAVIDLKYGKSPNGLVTADHNPQLMLYGLGAIAGYSALYDFDQVELCIIQPRLDSYTSWDITCEELIRWGDREVRHIAALAFAGEGEYAAGDHCKYCRFALRCREYKLSRADLARMEFRMPPALSNEEVAEVLTQAAQLAAWASAIKEYAEDQAINHGVKFPGWKVVQGRSSRTFSDADAVQNRLDLEGYPLDSIAPRKLLGITAMDTLVGAKLLEKVLGELIIKPEGKPTLAPESDKRTEWHSAAAEFGSLE